MKAHNRIDLEGMKFGRLLVLGWSRTQGKMAMWKCRCDCGREVEIFGGSLRHKRTLSCGCFGKERRIESHLKHGATRGHTMNREYRAWCCMKARCNPNHKQHKDYGGRGISVCDRWVNSFENFFSDMGSCPPRMTLDRIDNDLGYYKQNCRWATRKQQGNNTRRNIILSFCGESKTAQTLLSLIMNASGRLMAIRRFSISGSHR